MDDIQRKLERIAKKTDQSYSQLELKLYKKIAHAALGEDETEETVANVIDEMYTDYVEDADNEGAIEDAFEKLLGDSDSDRDGPGGAGAGSGIGLSGLGSHASAREELLTAAQTGSAPSSIAAMARSQTNGEETLAALAEEMSGAAYGTGVGGADATDVTAERIVDVHERAERDSQLTERSEARAARREGGSEESWGTGVSGSEGSTTKSRDDFIAEIVESGDEHLGELTEADLESSPTPILRKAHAAATRSATAEYSRSLRSEDSGSWGTGVSD